MTMLRNVSLACVLGALGIAGAMSTVSAAPLSPLSGTFNFAIYNNQTSTNGLSTDPSQQGSPTNPLITPAKEIWAGTYTGPLDFDQESGGTSVAAFLESLGATPAQFVGTGSFTGVSIATLTQTISSKTFATSSVFVITGNVGGSVLNGTITHDDGITLADGAGTLINNPQPTSSDTDSYTGLTGAFTLDYAEANGLPAILDFTATPLPSTWFMLLSGLVGLGFMAYRRKDKALAFTAAA